MSLFENSLKETKEYGIVERVMHPLCYVSALPNARINDTVYFEDDSLGRVIGLKKDLVEILSFADNPPIVSKRVAYSGNSFKFGVGDDLLGKVVDPLGKSLIDNQNIEISAYFPLDAKPLEISKRSRVKKQFLTGVSIIDSLVPLGFGQRELILGDRKTGKSSLIIPLIQSAIKQNIVIIYCGIGKRAVELKKIKNSLESLNLMSKVCMIASRSDSNPAVIELTPFSGMALCEYFKSKKISSLLILDDLSTHAKAYREISLTAKRFPGRDSYPGDIFFKHSKLLERGGNFIEGEKEVSITILPVAETYEGNLSDYIVSNLIGITDGHLLFDSKMFNRGIRPAIDVFLSVTRVGKQTQNALSQSITYELTSYLALYEKALEFSHFGSELSPDLKKVLVFGEYIYKLFEQGLYEVIPLNLQYFLLSICWTNALNIVKSEEIQIVKQKFLTKYEQDKNFIKFVDDIVQESKNAKDLCDKVLLKQKQVSAFYV